MKVLVTGPDGVLGSNLVRELISRGHDVTAFTEAGKPSPTLENLPIKMVSGNLLDRTTINEITKGIDIVVHCAALTTVFPARSAIVNKVNVDGTQYIVDACLENKVQRLIFVGSANSFGPGKIAELGNETKPFIGAKYKLDYIESKFKAKNLVLDAVKNRGLDAIVVCPTFMIGPYDSKPSSGAMILGVYNKKIPGYTLGGKNYVAVKDVAVAIANGITTGKKGECYILGNDNLTYKAAFEKMAAVVGVTAPKRRLPTRLVITLGWLTSKFATWFRYYPAFTYEMARISTEDHYYSSQKAQDDLALPHTPLDVALKESFDWFEKNGYLKKK